MGALEATSWALKMAEHELGITPVLSAQAMVAGSDPLGLIAYLSHFHSAFKSIPHNPGELEDKGGTTRVCVCVRKGQTEQARERPLRDILGEVSFSLLGWLIAVFWGYSIAPDLHASPHRLGRPRLPGRCQRCTSPWQTAEDPATDPDSGGEFGWGWAGQWGSCGGP